jgi:hypothetical protein
MVRTPHRYVPLERRGFDDEVTESRSSPLRVHFLDYKEEEADVEDEQISRMTFDDSSLSPNNKLQIIPPPAPRLGNELYQQVPLFNRLSD